MKSYYEMKNGLVVMQAEKGEFKFSNNSANGTWKKTTQFNGEDGTVMLWKGQDFFNTKKYAGTKETAPIEFNFEVDEPGTYYVTLRAIRPVTGEKGDRNNDFFLDFEGQGYKKIFFSGDRNEFKWAGQFDPGHGKKKVPATIKVTEKMIKENDGVFTLTVGARSNNAGFDEVHIQKGKASRDDDAPTSKLIKGSGSNNNPPPQDSDNDNNNKDNVDPVAKDDSLTTGHNKTQFVDVLKNDSDKDGDKLTIKSIDYDGNTSNVSISNGKIKVDPKSNVNKERVEEIDYVVSDGNGGTDKGTLKVTVEAKGGATPPPPPPADDNGGSDDTPPVAKNDTATTKHDKTITVDVLKNDTDPDGGKLRLTDVEYEGSTSIVSISGGKIKVNPLKRATEDRVEEITYTVTDNEGDTDTATLKVNVGAGAPVNPDPVEPPSGDDAPVAKNDSASTKQNKTILVDVLANDSNPGGGKLKLVDVDYGGKSSIVKIAGDMIMVNPLKRFDDDRVETITYTVENAAGEQSQAVLRVDVGNPQNATVEPVEGPAEQPVEAPAADDKLDLFIADADSDKTLVSLTDGAEISAAELTDNLTFFATSDDEDAFKFVELSFNGTTKKEAVEPYALFGDKNGDFNGGLDLDKGDYSIMVKGYDDNNQVVETVDIDFAIV